MTDVDITELDELEASKVSGVATAANGTPWLVLKSAASKSDSAETDQYQEEITGEGVTSKALSAADRKKMPASSFAFVDKKGGKHLPIHDEGHTKAALSRFGQQDFSEAKGKPADAKEAAARKIKSAAKKHGIDVSADSEVAVAAKKGAVQDALHGTKTPEEGGHLDTGHSSTAGSVTAGVKPAKPAADSLGGESSYVVPDEAKLVKAKAITSLVEAISVLDAQREAAKDGDFLQIAAEAEPKVPLTELTTTLASCVATLEEHLLCERIEAAVDPSEQSDVWDLEDAKSSLECALRLVAIFATMESLEDGASKSYLLQDADEALDAISAAAEYLNVLKKSDETTQAGPTAGEEETIQVDVTKDELAETIAAGTVAAVEAAFKAKADEAEAEKEKDAAEAAKNANNDGDVSEADVKATSEHDADDVNAVKGEGDEPEPETAAVKAVNDQLETLTKSLADVTELVTKIAKRPRAGGPSLDGQAHGVSPAAEGRQGDVTKSAEDNEIETLEKSLAEETDPLMKDELGRRLTYSRLMKLHESGQL